MNGQRVERILGIVLAVLVVIAALLSTVLEGNSGSVDGSVQSTLGSGRRAAMLLLAELGHDAQPWRQAPGAIPRNTQMVWLASPPQTLGMGSDDPDDPADERDFFASGPEGQALLGQLHHPESYYRFAERGGVLVFTASEAVEEFLVEQLDLLEFEDTIASIATRSELNARAECTVHLESTGEDVTLLWRARDPFLDSGSPLEAHYVDDRGHPLAISLQIGDGRILVMGDDVFLENGRIADLDHALFLLRFVEEFAPGGPVLFDEYALGRWKPMSAEELAFEPPYKSVTLHLLVLLLVFVWRHSWVREFPRDPRAIERLSALARARSSASLMERAGRWDMMRSGLEDRLPLWREWLDEADGSGASGLEAQALCLAAIEHEVEAAREQGAKRRSSG